MTASATKHFDTLAFVKKSKELGVVEEIAEYQARQIEYAIEIAVATANDEFRPHELATKTDLKQIEANIKQIEANIKQIEANIKQIEANTKQTDANIRQIEIKIEQYRYDSIKLIVWTGLAGVTFLSGLLIKGFHWF